jgi:hypothetical protein
MGNLRMYVYPNLIDIYDPNHPYAQANLRIKDGVPHLFVNDGAPRHFTIELQKHLDKLKTILILGG